MNVTSYQMHHLNTFVYDVPAAEGITYLRGVLGLPMIRRGERIFGSYENFSLMFSRTDGATYVKPYKNTVKTSEVNTGTLGTWLQKKKRSQKWQCEVIQKRVIDAGV